MNRYEYRFIRLKGQEREKYQVVVRQNADEGWRLVQLFAPGAGGIWATADFYEVVLERELDVRQGESRRS